MDFEVMDKNPWLDNIQKQWTKSIKSTIVHYSYSLLGKFISDLTGSLKSRITHYCCSSLGKFIFRFTDLVKPENSVIVMIMKKI